MVGRFREVSRFVDVVAARSEHASSFCKVLALHGKVLGRFCSACGKLQKSVVGRLRHHRHVAGDHVPVRMVWPWRWMVTVVSSKKAVQSMSQS